MARSVLGIMGCLILYSAALTFIALNMILRPRAKQYTRLQEKVSKNILVGSMAKRAWIALRNNKECAKAAESVDEGEEVHVGTIVLGHQNHMEKFEILLHSTLRSRDPETCHFYHFHVFTDEALLQHLRKSLNASRLAFKETFTSELFGFKITPYDGQQQMKAVLYSKAIESNSHYSGSPGLLKLYYEMILKDVDRLIALDCDVLVMKDLLRLWKVDMPAPRLIGIVSEQSEWYLDSSGEDGYRWPHIRSGFNSGVMLLDLARMRDNGNVWQRLWRKAFDKVHVEKPGQILHLGDQDIFNAAINDNPEILHEMECGWNVQDAGLTTRALFCRAEDWNIFHANFHAKNKNFWSGLMESFRLKNIGNVDVWQRNAFFICRDRQVDKASKCSRKDIRVFL